MTRHENCRFIFEKDTNRCPTDGNRKYSSITIRRHELSGFTIISLHGRVDEMITIVIFYFQKYRRHRDCITLTETAPNTKVNTWKKVSQAVSETPPSSIYMCANMPEVESSVSNFLGTKCQIAIGKSFALLSVSYHPSNSPRQILTLSNISLIVDVPGKVEIF